MEVLCLTGWQQEKDALANIASGALHFDYASYNDVERMFSDLPGKPDIAIGWSLGGQLLVRAIAGGYVLPKKLLLVSSPYQFVANEKFSDGVSQAEFNDIRNNYKNNAREMLSQFQSVIGYGDKNQANVIRKLVKTNEIWKNGVFWLDELGRANCGDDFRGFPETVIIHGENDKVVNLANAGKFAGILPGSHLVLLPGCSHAPHLHDPGLLKNIIGDCV